MSLQGFARRESGGLPAPPVVVLALDGFAIACDAGLAVFGGAAELPRLVAVAAAGGRVAASAPGAAAGAGGCYWHRVDRQDPQLPGVPPQLLGAAAGGV